MHTTKSTQYWEEAAKKKATHYINMRDMMPGSGMYREAMYQYKDMAQGGNGGPLGFYPSDAVESLVENLQPVTNTLTCRSYNYPNTPDAFFQRVLELVGE